MKSTLRGRPRLNITVDAVLAAVRRSGNVTHAAAELQCSPAYIHARLKEAGLTLQVVLESRIKRS